MIGENGQIQKGVDGIWVKVGVSCLSLSFSSTGAVCHIADAAELSDTQSTKQSHTQSKLLYLFIRYFFPSQTENTQ